MRQGIGIWLGVVAVAAVIIGPRMGHSLSDEAVWRNTLPGSGEDGAGVSREVVTKVLANTADTVHFVQAVSDGIYREVTIKWTPSDEKKSADDDLEIVLEDGRSFLVRHPTGAPTEDGLGFKISFDFYLPRSSMREEFANLTATSGSWTLAAVKRLLDAVFAPPAWAAGGQGWSGSFTDVKTFLKQSSAPEQGFREALREREVVEGRAKRDACFQFEIQKAQDWVRRMREWNAEMAAIGREGQAASALDNSPQQRALKAKWDTLYGQAREADARAYWKSLPQADRDRLSKSRTSGLDALMAKDQVQLDKQALKDRIAALRRCHEDPTAPTAIRAKNEGDPARKKISDALDAVELQVEIDSVFREGVAILNSAAASQLGPLGAGLTSTVGAIEDKMLKDSMEAAVASLEGCIVRCDSCDQGTISSPLPSSASNAAAPDSASSYSAGADQNYTPGPKQAYTPGPEQGSPPAPEQTSTPHQARNYTPGPTRQLPSPPPAQVCSPFLEGRLTYTVHDAHWVIQGAIWGEIATRTLINARLKQVKDEPGYYVDEGSTFHFRGATSMLHIAGECHMFAESWATENGDFGRDAGVINSGQINDDGRLALHFTAGIQTQNIHNKVEICGLGGSGHSDSYSAEFRDECWGDPVRPGQPGYKPGRKSFRFNCHESGWDATGILSQAE